MSRTLAKSSDDWFTSMRAHFAGARYREAGEVYDQAVQRGAAVTIDAILLRSRVLIKIDRQNVVPFIDRHDFSAATPTQLARRAIYLGAAYARLRQFNLADKQFADAAVVFRKGPLAAELATAMARRYLIQNDIESATAWFEQSKVDRSQLGKIRAEHLHSYILGHRQLYREQGAALIRVLDLIGEQREAFAEDWYAAVHTLAGLARELPVPEFAARALVEVERDVAWSADFEVSRFQALKAVAWCKALSGDALGCFRLLRKAETAAPSEIWRSILFLDRAYFAASVGESKWAGNEFAAAEESTAAREWDQSAGDERVALLLLAELSTAFAPSRATYYLAEFVNLGRFRSNLQQFSFDDRLEAMAMYTTGIVALSSEDSAKAEESLRAAWSTFDRIGYDVRAARCALALFKVTQKRRWLHLAEDKLEAYPDSWLKKELLASDSEMSSPIMLTPMQERVSRLVCEGLSTEQIAERMGRSRYTVFNHLKLIYRKFGVRSREGLVAAAMRRGML